MWKQATPKPTISDGAVHVWRATLDVPGHIRQELSASLSADEVARADRFHFERDRSRFVVARGVLRTILGRYLQLDPSEIRFRYNQYGKPALERRHHRHPLNFNLSHAGQLALYALAVEREVGVDLEQVRTDLAFMSIAAAVFSPSENDALRRLPAELRPIAFFNCWTRKEAYIKARGKGLSLPLDRFDVSLTPGAPAALLKAWDEPEATARWSVQELSPGDGFVAAIAAEGRDWTVEGWQFDMGQRSPRYSTARKD